MHDELERLRNDVHSCHPGCTRAGCVNERLRAENADLRHAISRACAGYPDDDTAPTCVAILRAALKPNVGIEPPERSARMTG